MLKNRLLNINPFLFIFIFIISSTSLYAVHDYANALYLSTYFYGAQRCGDTASWCHGACHVKDGLAPGGTGIDLTGGWHDCGDHVTFGQTAPYAAGVLIAGYLMNPSSYEDSYSTANSAPPSNGIPDVLDEAKIMTDLLIKCITGGRFYYQKGNGDYDHKHMDEPRDFSLNYTITEGGETDGGRPLSYVTSGGSNVCGDAAAALAYMAIAYAPYDAAYATTCFTKAKEVYAIGDTNPGTVSGGSYYGAANYQDDMAWGGAVINRASRFRGAAESTYLTKAQTYMTSGAGAGSWPLCYDHTEVMAHYELYLLAGAASDLTWLQNEVTWYKTQMKTCGIGQYAHVTSWGSLRYAANMAFAAMMLYDLNSDNTAYTFAKANVDFILGTHGDISGTPNCPQGRSFLIGYTNPDYPSAGSVAHPHHRAAFGKTKASGADTQWQTENSSPGSIAYAYQLKGALVGGPQADCGTYNDRIDDYTSNEVGVDYNAGLVGALAAIKYVLNPVIPTITFTRTNTPVITNTFTITNTYTATNTNTRTPTFTPTATRTVSPTPTFTWTLVSSPSNTSTRTFSPTFTGTFTLTNTETRLPSFTFTATKSPTPANTGTLTITVTFTASPTETFTRTPSFTGTNTPTGAITPTYTVSNTGTVSPTDTQFAGTPTDTQTITQTFTATLTHTLTSTGTFTATGTYTLIVTRTYTPSFTVTASFTQTPSQTSVFSATQTGTSLPTATNTSTLIGTPVETYTQTDTPVIPADTFTETETREVLPDTITPTKTQTATNTCSNTLTPAPTATNTPVASGTQTITNTKTCTYTITLTYTQTPAGTVVFTETAEATPSALEVVTATPVIIYPNPNPVPGTTSGRVIEYFVSRPISRTVFKVYTNMGRLIRKAEERRDQFQGAKCSINVDGSYFQGLSRGVYYFVIIVTDKETGKEAKSPIEKFLIQ